MNRRFLRFVLIMGAAFVCSVQAANPTTLLTDNSGISGFELYGPGVYWWSGPGRCSGEFPHQSTIRSRGVWSSATHTIASDCLLLEGSYDNAVRDDMFVYFFSERQLWRKAINAAAADASEVLTTSGFTPTLPVGQEGARLELANGRLYWSRFTSTSGKSDIYSMATDGTEAPKLVASVSGGAEIRKLKWLTYEGTLGQPLEGLVIQCGNGKLYRYQMSSGPLLQLATGVSDFAVHRRSTLLSSTTTIYATTGADGSFAPNNSPGKLLDIDARTGAASVIYTAQGDNQLLSVATDSDEFLAFVNAPTKHLYVAEGIAVCGELFCSISDVVIRRHTLPGNSTSWDLIVSTGAGGNLRSDDDYLYFHAENSIKAIPTGAPALQLELQADAVEVVQSIQDLNSSVPLVANRPIYVRAYAHLKVNTTGHAQWFPGASLRGYRNGKELPGSPISPNNSPAITVTNDLAILRGSLDRGYFFELPPDWTASSGMPIDILTFEFTVNPEQEIIETGANPKQNNTVTSKPASLFVKGWPCIVTVPLLCVGPTYYASSPGFSQILDRAKSLLPVEGLSVYTYAVTEAQGDPDEPFDLGNNDPEVADDAMSDALDLLDDLDLESDPCEDHDGHYLGLVHPQAGKPAGFNGVSWIDDDVLLARMETNKVSSLTFGGGKTIAHEMGHNYGLLHIHCPDQFPPGQDNFDLSLFPCSLGIPDADLPSATFGYDPLTQRVIAPGDAADLMSYASSRWITAQSWTRLLGLTAGGILGSADRPAAEVVGRSSATPGQALVLLVRGRVDVPRQMGLFRTFKLLPETMAPAYHVSRSRAASVKAAGMADPYRLRLVDNAGKILSETALAMKQGHVEYAPEVPKINFSQYIDFQPQARLLQLVRTNRVLAERLVTLNAPVVSVSAPLVDAAAQTVFINWAASDADGDPLIFTVQYSSDDGAHWATLKSDYKSLAVTLSTRMLPGSQQCRLRVQASDGVNCGFAVSAPFTIAQHAPEPQIDGVTENARVDFGTVVNLHGTALDAESASEKLKLEWRLNGRAFLVNPGAFLTLHDLTPGQYVATLTAADPDQQSATATRHFEVSPCLVPTAPAPTLDGLPNDPGYAQAAFIRLPLGNSDFAQVRLLHSGTNLYVSFSNLKYETNRLGNHSIGLVIDANASGGALVAAGDIGFFVDEDGTPWEELPVRGSLQATLTPKPGFTAVIQRGTGRWSAEFRISDALIGGWNHAANLMLAHDSFHWPVLAQDNSPATWAAAYLGSQPALPVNRPPIANAGPDQELTVGKPRSIYLDGSATTDPDQDALTYAWTQASGPAVQLLETNTVAPYFTASPVTEPTAFGFQLVVRDASGHEAADQVQVQILPPLPRKTIDPTNAVPVVRGDGLIQMRLSGEPRKLYRVQVSDNLVNWTDLKSVYADSIGWISFTIVAPDITKPQLYYRAAMP
jgi:hypothetical protein